MFVDTNNVAYFLAERRLLSFDSVVDGDFMVVDQSSRNRNLKIIRRKSPGFFIKQITQRTPEFIQSMEREATCYRLAKQDPAFRSLHSLMPRFHYFDSANHILVVELLENSESLWEYHQRLGRFATDVASMQGEKLGAYHRQTKINGNGNDLSVFNRQLPWILSIHETNPMYLGQISQGNSQLINILQQYPDFQTALASIKAGWTYSTLIHGDIKWENMMLCNKGVDGVPELRIIDWEIADIGDECWDVGGVIQAYLTFWIFSLPLNSGLGLAEVAASSPFDADSIKPALASYWSSYFAARKLDPSASREMLARCVSCAAARMIQTAYESIQASPQISPHALCKLQMSLNILRDPGTAITDLMGL